MGYLEPVESLDISGLMEAASEVAIPEVALETMRNCGLWDYHNWSRCRKNMLDIGPLDTAG